MSDPQTTKQFKFDDRKKVLKVWSTEEYEPDGQNILGKTVENSYGEYDEDAIKQIIANLNTQLERLDEDEKRLNNKIDQLKEQENNLIELTEEEQELKKKLERIQQYQQQTKDGDPKELREQSEKSLKEIPEARKKVNADLNQIKKTVGDRINWSSK